MTEFDEKRQIVLSLGPLLTAALAAMDDVLALADATDAESHAARVEAVEKFELLDLEIEHRLELLGKKALVDRGLN